MDSHHLKGSHLSGVQLDAYEDAPPTMGLRRAEAIDDSNSSMALTEIKQTPCMQKVGGDLES
jgi:hypothetical protein